MLSLTESAKEYFKKVTTELQPFVSLSVVGGGCSGFQYKWDLTDSKENGILLEDILVVDTLAELYIVGCTVDYVTELGASYLKIKNPNAIAQCGCGESFGV